jgi:zinc protease
MNYLIKQSILLIVFTNILALSKIPDIEEFTLSNGLKVIVQPSKDTDNVSIQMYYNVGSKDEKENEKGLAHLLEHMIFKGTKNLSEVDITLVTDKLSGWCNASTSADRTCYEFNLPTRHWKKAIPILADCMTNCTFKDDHLNSEFKTVIQELKMNRDDYNKSLFLELMATCFPDHPYHFPTIGYKQHIWNVKGKDLHKFYKKHYIPNNAVLVIVGDIKAEEAFRISEKYFGNIPNNPHYKKKNNFLNKDLISRNVTLYRDVKKPTIYLSFVIPGLKDKKTHLANSIKNALTGDNFSRLSKILVEQKQLVYSIFSTDISIYEYGLFWIYFEPKDMNNCHEISNLILSEIIKLKEEGLSNFEIKKIKNQLKSAHYDLMENNRYKASLIGEYYLSSNDYTYPFKNLEIDKNQLNNELKQYINEYLRPCVMSICQILPIPENEKSNWQTIQDINDNEDNAILKERIRESEIEKPNYANSIEAKNIKNLRYKIPQEFILQNGLKVLFVKDSKSPKVNLTINLKANNTYEPKNMPAIYNLVCSTIYRGTNKSNYENISNFLNKKAIELYFAPGIISLSCINSNFNSAIKLLTEILNEPLFDESEIKKSKELLKNNIRYFWDSPAQICSHMLNNAIYKDTPLENQIPSEDQIDSYTKDNIIQYYKKFITPDKAYIVVSGDIDFDILKNNLDTTLGNWTGEKIQELDYQFFTETKNDNIHFEIDRDQTFLAIGTKSISHEDHDYHKLLLASLILSSGMSSKLFLIREQTGLYYNCNGSFIKGTSKNPGMINISTIISKNNIEKVKELFLNLITNFDQIVTEEDLIKAKNLLLENYSTLYSTRTNIINTISHLYYYNYEWDYYKKLPSKINSISLNEVKEAVIRLIKDKEYVTVTVGR